MDYINKASEIEESLNNISSQTRGNQRNQQPMKKDVKNSLLNRLTDVEAEVKQEETYSKVTLATGILLLVLILPILIAIFAIFAPILSLPICIILLVLFSTALVGGIATIAIAVKRLLEGKGFFLKIKDLKEPLEVTHPIKSPALAPQQNKNLEEAQAD